MIMFSHILRQDSPLNKCVKFDCRTSANLKDMYARIQNVMSEGANFDVFLVDKGREGQNSTSSGPPSVYFD